MNERRIHQMFELGVLLKGAHALLECAGGLLFAFISTSDLARIVAALTRDELIEDPNDFIAAHLLGLARGLSASSEHFYAFYLLAHGVVKIVLVVGLLKNRLWAYPLSVAVLGLFIVYQIYRFSHTHAIGLLALTVLDVVVVALIWHEYRLLRKHGPPAGPIGL